MTVLRCKYLNMSEMWRKMYQISESTMTVYCLALVESEKYTSKNCKV